ncbi:MAG: proton-conducting membrane transporter, partial [Lachnospiraceae bacterium]|nr:proton-conducting membrane transporter [Lachnospiraceae bacterium]
CGLALVTVLIGSVLASREQLLKRRLAYSTIGQVSYALFGIFVLNRTALLGALLHVVFHSIAKNTLFLCAGTFIHETGHTRAGELEGIGKRLPVTTWIFTFASLTLIGIPPTSAFLSKWYLAQGSLEGAPSVLSWLGPVILLISAVFTAAYLLTITVKGFFPGGAGEEEHSAAPEREATLPMLIPPAVLAVFAVGFGIFPGGLMRFLEAICRAVLN